MEGRIRSQYSIPRNHGHNFPGFGKDPLFGSIREETTNMSLARSDMSLINAARNRGHNTEVGRGVWSLHAKVPEKPYDRMVFSKDVYPRNPVTMMPVHKNAPKYFDGRFLTYDYKDMIPVSKPSVRGGEERPIVFKPEHIENVQTKKKYVTLKGKTSVPLHLINDVNSELFQRSLNVVADKSSIEKNRSADDIYESNPRDRETVTSGMTPSSKALNISSKNSEWSFKSSKVFNVKDDVASWNDAELRSGKIYTEPDWMASDLLREKIANTLKFMGKASYHKTPRAREYDINFG